MNKNCLNKIITIILIHKVGSLSAMMAIGFDMHWIPYNKRPAHTINGNLVRKHGFAHLLNLNGLTELMQQLLIIMVYKSRTMNVKKIVVEA